MVENLSPDAAHAGAGPDTFVPLSNVITPLGTAFAKAINDLYRVGGLILVILWMSAILMVLGFFLAMSKSDLTPAYFAFGAATALLLMVAAGITAKTLIPALKNQRMIKENGEMLNTVQNATMELIRILQQVNDYALMNSTQIVAAVERAKVSLAGIPLADRAFSFPVFSRTDEIGNKIRMLAAHSRETLEEIHDSISKSDVSKLERHFGELKALRTAVEQDLFTPAEVRANGVVVTATSAFAKAAEQTTNVISTTHSMSQKLVDVLERTSSLSTRISSSLEAFAKIRGLLHGVPIIGASLDQEPFRSLQSLTNQVGEVGKKTKYLADNMHASLTRPTAASLQATVDGLTELQALLTRVAS